METATAVTNTPRRGKDPLAKRARLAPVADVEKPESGLLWRAAFASFCDFLLHSLLFHIGKYECRHLYRQALHTRDK